MKLYLSSYKLGNNTIELKKWIKKHGNKIVLIPNSRDVYEESERKTLGINSNVEALQTLGFDTRVLSLKDYFSDYDKLKEELKEYHAFFVIGENTFALRKAMQLSGFDNYLREISKKENYLYAGYSAGICVLSPSLNGLDLVDEPINPYNDEEVLYEGIGILDYVPIPHYKSNHPESKMVENVVEYCKNHGIKYKTLQDGDVLVQETENELEKY